MTINELLTLLNSYSSNKYYYISSSSSMGKNTNIMMIKENYNDALTFKALVINDCIQCIFDYRKLLFIAEGFKDNDDLRLKCGKYRVSTRNINLFIKNTLKYFYECNIKLIAIPFLDYCYNKEPNKLIEMI